MPYTAFEDAKPVATDNGLTVVDDIRHNLMALRDAVVAGGMVGWNYSASGGSAHQRAEVIYSKGTERIRGTLTWGTLNGADGNVTKAIWAYSADSGVTYDAIGTEAIAYDADANVTAVTWA